MKQSINEQELMEELEAMELRNLQSVWSIQRDLEDQRKILIQTLRIVQDLHRNSKQSLYTHSTLGRINK